MTTARVGHAAPDAGPTSTPSASTRRSGRVEEALDGGGRAAVLERGWIVLRGAGRRPRRLVEAADAAGHLRRPVALQRRQRAGGRRRVRRARPRRRGRSSTGCGPSARTRRANPGRLNLFERRGTFALVDFAHNEAGLAGLMDVARVRRRGPSGAAGVRHGRRPHRRDPARLGVHRRQAPTTSSSPRSATTSAAGSSRT